MAPHNITAHRSDQKIIKTLLTVANALTSFPGIPTHPNSNGIDKSNCTISLSERSDLSLAAA
jgi:hypothetical protein